MKHGQTRATASSAGRPALAASALVVLLISCLAAQPALAGQLCGNGFLDEFELCDDGNNVDGDGCSRLCNIEAGYLCTDPFVTLEPNALVDNGGFEQGPGAAWENAGSIEPVICSVAECASEPAGARNGAFWAQLGGVAEQEWTLLQQVDLNAQARLLKFDAMFFECGTGSPNDVVAITLNGNPVWLSDATDPQCAEGQRYSTTVVNLDDAPGGPYAQTGAAELALRVISSSGQLGVAFDNIEIGKLLTSPVPSICTIDPNVSLYQPFENIDGPLGPPDFAQQSIGEFEIFWGTTSDGVCGAAQSPPGNHTGEPGEAACIDSTFLSPLAGDDRPAAGGDKQAAEGVIADVNRLAGVIETYVCNAPVDLSFKLQSQLQLVVNYQPGPITSQDFFGVWVDSSPFFGPLSNGISSARLLVNEPQGVFGESPGVTYEFDISDLDGQPQVYVCFGYGNENAGYAQVDTVILSSDGCTDDFEEDKILSCSDNCTNVDNPSQLDSDNDGYGNACDGDIAKNGTAAESNASGNDCQVNFSDLFTFSEAMFSVPTQENWNPDADFNDDGVVNFLDLTIFRDLFLMPPGPSGVSTTCSASSM